LAAKLSIQRPEYLSNEDELEFGLGAFVTTYRVLMILEISTGAIWVEWLFAGFITSLCINFNLAQVNEPKAKL